MQCCSPSPNEPHDQNNTNQRKKTPRSRPTTPSRMSNKRHRDDKTHTPAPGPDLAPIYYSPSSQYPFTSPTPIQEFPSMPPMSTLDSLAGTGCTCGIQCSCPGCVEHRGSLHANRDRRDCHDGCGTCIDPSLETSLPGTSNSLGTSFLDRFFARAAALPPPPSHRKMHLDPMDTTLYMDTARLPGSNTVNLPKLECCGGQCICPAGQCSCRASCVGCSPDTQEDNPPSQDVLVASAPMESGPSTVSIRSCCAGKA